MIVACNNWLIYNRDARLLTDSFVVANLIINGFPNILYEKYMTADVKTSAFKLNY